MIFFVGGAAVGRYMLRLNRLNGSQMVRKCFQYKA